MDWFDYVPDIDWSKVAERTIPAAVGAGIAANANSRAAAQVASANSAGNQAMIDRMAAARGQLQPIADQTQIGVNQLRNVVAQDPNAGITQHPMVLRPDQEYAMGNINRDAQRAVASGPMRGSARASTAILKDVTAGAQAGFQRDNVARTDQLRRENVAQSGQAANILANQNFSAHNQMAGNETNIGTNIANNLQRTGETQAAASVATGKVIGDTVGKAVAPEPQIADTLSIIRGINADERKGRYNRTPAQGGV